MRDLLTRSSLLLAPLLLESALGYPAQAPLASPSQPFQVQNYTGYELRRYGISNRQDLIHMAKTLNSENADIWDLTPTHVDVHMDTTNLDLSDALSTRTYSTLPYSFPYNHTYHPTSTPVPLPDVSSLQNTTFHTAYHTIEEIELFATALATAYPRLVEIVLLGSSWENRDVFAIRIGKRGSGKKNKKGKKGKKGRHGARVHAETGKEAQTCKRRGHTTMRHSSWMTVVDSSAVKILRQWFRSVFDQFTRIWRAGVVQRAPSMQSFYVDESPVHAQRRPVKDRVVIQGAQHAREWIATSTALYLAHALVAPKKEPGSLRHLLDQNDFTIIPVPNPDGYAYTWTTDRLWYKNRMDVLPGNSTPKSDDCKGIDMNRNWGYEWNSSTMNVGPDDPCSHWYPGAYPFQAPEVTAIANYIRRTPKIQAFIDLRSYGQKLMYPYSYACDVVPPHAEDIIEAALGATKALRERHNTPYTSGASCELLYPAPGNIIDWMYGDAKVKYSYSLMLRDTGTYGFMLPPRWIQPVGEETASGVASLVKFIEDLSSSLGNLTPSALPVLREVSAYSAESRLLLPNRLGHIRSIFCLDLFGCDIMGTIAALGVTLPNIAKHLPLNLGFEVHVEEPDVFEDMEEALVTLGCEVSWVESLGLCVTAGSFDSEFLSERIVPILQRVANLHTLTLISAHQGRRPDDPYACVDFPSPLAESKDTAAHKNYLKMWQLARPNLHRIVFHDAA
ncbi:extracellular matrix protein 14 [Ceratobasidium sp. AG-Ba]|nr:extracellular matrix protein 14 [Ceratobasidium sp. AG-Ba]